jgi:hypothetical protein
MGDSGSPTKQHDRRDSEDSEDSEDSDGPLKVFVSTLEVLVSQDDFEGLADAYGHNV